MMQIYFNKKNQIDDLIGIVLFCIKNFQKWWATPDQIW